MRSASLLLSLLLAACGPRGRATRTASADSAGLAGDSVDRVLVTPRVVRHATVVVFVLPAVDDTMLPDDAAAAIDEFRYATSEAAPFFQAHRIELVFTNSDSIFVEQLNRRRRLIVLADLDAPLGYVLIEPGLQERILTGVYSADELQQEAQAYFTTFASDSVPGPRQRT